MRGKEIWRHSASHSKPLPRQDSTVNVTQQATSRAKDATDTGDVADVAVRANPKSPFNVTPADEKSSGGTENPQNSGDGTDAGSTDQNGAVRSDTENTGGGMASLNLYGEEFDDLLVCLYTATRPNPKILSSKSKRTGNILSSD